LLAAAGETTAMAKADELSDLLSINVLGLVDAVLLGDFA
jgi:hypothetical protein